MLHADLQRNANDAATAQADTVGQLAAEGKLPDLLPLTHGADFIQVVDSSGRVVAASQNLVGRPAVAHLRPHEGRLRATWSGEPFGEGHRQRIVAVTAQTPGGAVTVYAGTSLRDADAADEITKVALGIGTPLLLATVALVTWWVTGRALRPVEAIRSEVAEITGRALHRRVPVPAAQDEVARLARTMNATLDRLEDAVVRQRRFIADASHELRSPITVLRTQLEVALAHPDPALWPDLVRDALEDTVRLQDLASDLLLLARLDAAEPVSRIPLDMAELCRTTVAARHGDRLPVDTRLQPGLTVEGNRGWLVRLLTNLLDNAQRHADRRIELVLHTDQDARLAVLEVTDDGPGIPDADRERIFERFTRLDDARSRDLGGAGLGLAIARDIAHQHHGTLRVEPHPNGAGIVARLPLSPSGP
ncbi:HAMP domain-containing protein [Streptomyces sp. RLA2-12]|nr:HAMP domain-containing protein [Streptomyces sp. RLA2-12]QDN63738.1 HAMP domain-containing protein [Streptomyces sp. S1D4-20]QDN73780.1 HAMP domain-containing protein [Streptomyces sp. S1D4-14]QDO56367.1 HAMP domain-containing protein [Streptomyces sp. RLB3-5]QDO66268.1 HAMP domain-containing protein [Streptomyces sp. RLB1-8]